jgi:glycosyltransferase involved in cell wall biosynthesis
LYLGRLRPSKGLDVLLRAWARVSRRFPDWHLVIAGFDADHYQSLLVALASELGLADSIEWPGAVHGQDRERVFGAADVLVLPSYYENFGLVVAEALVRGVPVVATHGAPWSALVEQACGWWIPTGVEPLAAALSDALGRPAADLAAMGERGRQYARARFRWEDTARSMRSLYGWLLGEGPMPSFVTT